jgi:hypothetical protein
MSTSTPAFFKASLAWSVMTLFSESSYNEEAGEYDFAPKTAMTQTIPIKTLPTAAMAAFRFASLRRGT